MGIFTDSQGQLTPQSEVRSGLTSNSSKLSCMSSLPASIKKISSNTTKKKWQRCFLHNNPMEAICCHGNHSSHSICPKTLCSLSPNPMLLQTKFDCNCPGGLRDINVCKCGHTDTARVPSYKLTMSLWLR